MEKTKKLTVLAMVLLFMASTAQAQVFESEEESELVETTIAADFVSQYVWRGQDLGNASLQPTLGIAWKGLSLTAWGSVGVADANDTKEIDLTLEYNIGGLNIGITDYWTNQGADPQNRYFKYDAHGTNHVFEANVGYDFGPVALQWYTNFAGNDGVNDKGKRAYSSYLEMTVPFRLAKVEWEAAAGAVPFETDFYGTTGFAVTNLSVKATKEVKLNDKFSIPLFAQFAANPCDRKAYLVFGMTLQPW
jgi:hypothetical protein